MIFLIVDIKIANGVEEATNGFLRVKLYSLWHHKALVLIFGFLTGEERSAFRQLVKISGVGPRTALAVLSGLSVAELAQAVTQQEAGRLVKVPGIGKKTAERLLLELKGRLGADFVLPTAVASEAQADIVQALVALGYGEREAASALKSLPADVGVSEGIKLALRALSK